jgi:hypothetical protein
MEFTRTSYLVASQEDMMMIRQDDKHGVCGRAMISNLTKITPEWQPEIAPR